MSGTILKCNDCKARFYEPVVREYTEHYEYWGAPFTKVIEEATCPHCDSEDIDEIWEDAYDEDIDGEDEYEEDEEG